MNRAKRTSIIFITATDTGVGKTVLTALLLTHLRELGCKALAIKPFCSGGRDDASLLCAAQDNTLTLEEINPFFFPEPVAPMVSARLHRRSVPIKLVINHIRKTARLCETLLIEGSGGLLVPLGEDYTVLDLIIRLRCDVIILARNKLGTINHTLLTALALRNAGFFASRFTFQVSRSSCRSALKVVLMNPRRKDLSSTSNARILAELLAPVPLLALPFLGATCRTPAGVRKAAKISKHILARILA